MESLRTFTLLALLAIAGIAQAAVPVKLVVVSGSSQAALEGTELPGPFVVQALDATDTPVPYAIISFTAGAGNDPYRFPQGRTAAVFGTFDGMPSVEITADERGIATSPRFTIAMAPIGGAPGNRTGHGYVRAQALSPEGSSAQGVAYIGYDVELASGRRPTPQDLWWGGPVENGWGLSVVEHYRLRVNSPPTLFVVLFIYDAQGNPTWYVMPAGFWDTPGYGTTWRGSIYKPTGSPFFAYDPGALRVGNVEGELFVRLVGKDRMRLEYRMRDGLSGEHEGSKRLVRQDFTADAPSPRIGLGDMWWGGIEQNGWGFSLMEQPGNLFGVWFTYDASGAPTWLFVPGGSWTGPTMFEGDLYRALGAPWIGVPYDAGALRIEAAGRLRMDAASLTRLRVEYEADGHRGVLSLERQPFAPNE